MAKVCNPIYDTVFKYLVEDERVAKVLLGGILNKKIEHVEIKGHECEYHSENTLKFLRFDFAGTIENPDGTKETVTIELQKASEPEEVMRFRSYFGLQMASKSNADSITKYHRDKDKTPYNILKARHIYGIFILGHSLGKGFEYPLIKGNTVFYDEDNNVLNFETQCEFLKGMTYDLYIIQIPFLPERPKKPLEKMFRAFDQRYKVANDAKFLELTEDDDDDSGYNVIFRRLLYAASDEQLRGNLDLEDYAERMWTIQQAEKEDLEYELIEKRQQLDETKGRLAEAKDQLEDAKDQLKEQQNQLSEAKDQLKEQQNQLSAMIKFSASLGASPDQIAAQLGITRAEVGKVINDLGK